MLTVPPKAVAESPSPQVCGDADQRTDEEVQSEDGGDHPAGGCREHRLPEALSSATKRCEQCRVGLRWERGLVGVGTGGRGLDIGRGLTYPLSTLSQHTLGHRQPDLGPRGSMFRG